MVGIYGLARKERTPPGPNYAALMCLSVWHYIDSFFIVCHLAPTYERLPQEVARRCFQEDATRYCTQQRAFVVTSTRAHNVSSNGQSQKISAELTRPLFFFPLWRCGPTRAMASSFFRFLDHTQRRTTVGRTPLDGWSARRRDLYVTTHNIHNRQTSMPPVGFEPTISAGERP